MKVLLTVATLVTVAGAAGVSLGDLEFHAWKLRFGKSYGSTEEESWRKMIWLTNRKLVLEHNMLADQGIKTYRLGMNHFADLDTREYQAIFSGCLRSFNRTQTRSATPILRQAGGTTLPKTVDWRKKGYVTEVKSQMTCGSCWAFSTTGGLEGQMFRKTGKLIPLSEQQLVDCSFSFGNNGCGGGWPEQAFDYVKSSGGLQSEDSYPYDDKEGKCRFQPEKINATCQGYEELPIGDENALQKSVATVGPVSAGIDIGRHTFQLYESGVYDDPYCSSTYLNHAVLVVGYGIEDKELEYWLVKNSWGVTWGENGYIRMSRNKRNQCGIATSAVFPIV